MTASRGGMGKANYLYDRKYNAVEEQKRRADRILAAPISVADKLWELAYNPFSDRNIVEYVVKYGIDLTNIFQPENLLDEQGNDFRDFLESDNNFYFGSIQSCLLKVAPEQKRLVSGEREIDLDLYRRAVETWEKLNDLLMIPDEDWETQEIAEYYQKALAYIEDCAENAFGGYPEAERQKYIGEQRKIVRTGICENVTKEQAREFCKRYETTGEKESATETAEKSSNGEVFTWRVDLGEDKVFIKTRRNLKMKRQIQCPHCESEWTVSEEILASVTGCPFCGKSLSGQGETSEVATPSKKERSPQMPMVNGNDFDIAGGVLVRYKGKGKTTVIPKKVKSIASMAFLNNETIREIVFEEGCTEIGESAFQGCTKLWKIELPNTLIKIQTNAFKNCYSLQRVVMPKEVEEIGSPVFSGCPNLSLYVAADAGKADYLDTGDGEAYLCNPLVNEKYIAWRFAVSEKDGLVGAKETKIVYSYYGSPKLEAFTFYTQNFFDKKLAARWEKKDKYLSLSVKKVGGFFCWKQFDKAAIKEVKIKTAKLFSKGVIEYHIRPNGVLKYTFGGESNKAARQLYKTFTENGISVTLE